MSTKAKGPQFILKVPAGMKMPAGISGQEVPTQAARPQKSEAPARETMPAAPARVPVQASEQAFEQAFEQAPAPVSSPAPQPQAKITESYLSAKLRQSERKERPKSLPGSSFDNDGQMAGMWREMEERIAYKAPQASKLPADFLRSMGLEGETILISPRAVEALKGMLGGKKNG